jgi:ElaB/YqjD/DUF883 family membrane-anchored ribosome-binding protein
MSTARSRLGKQATKATNELHKISGIATDGRKKVHRVERNVERFIQKRPLKSVLVAAGVGLLVGGIWMRRRPRVPLT